MLKMEQNLRLIPAADIGACCVDHAHESVYEIADHTLLLQTLVHSSQLIPIYIKKGI